jgi:rod shape-determining protein MreD
MKGLLSGGILLLMLLLLQTTVLSNSFLKPDGALVVTLVFALLKGPEYGAGAGFFGGLIEDGLSGFSKGGFCLIDLLTGWIIGYAAEKMNSKNFFVLIGSAAVGAALQYFGLSLYFYLSEGLKWKFHFQFLAAELALQSLLTAAAVFILRPLFSEETILLP